MIDDTLNLDIKYAKRAVRWCKKERTIIVIALMISFSVIFFDACVAYKYELSNVTYLFIGLIIGNIVYLTTEFFKNKIDLDSERNCLEHYLKMQRDYMFSDLMRRIHERERVIAGYQEEYADLLRFKNAYHESKPQESKSPVAES